MKKILFTLIAFVSCISMNAQTTKLYKDGYVIAEYTDSQLDSIVFSKTETPTPEPTTTHEYVDLGLPSGTLWATCNVGADKPEEYGLYFAWGEIIGYGGDSSDGRTFDWTDYKLCNGKYGTLTKYCCSSDLGTVDNKTVLEAVDDAATVNWGSNWCMPTSAQMNELVNSNYTNSKWTTTNGVYGRLITSKVAGFTDKSIFLPAAGARSDSYSSSVGSNLHYWSSEGSDICADALYYDKNQISSIGGSVRFCGFSVRPVCVNKADRGGEGGSDATIPDNSIVVDGTAYKINVVEVSSKGYKCDLVDGNGGNTVAGIEIETSDKSVFPTKLQEVNCEVELYMGKTEWQIKDVPVKVSWDGTTLQVNLTNLTLDNGSVSHVVSASYNGGQIE